MWVLHTQRCWEDRHELPIMVTAIKGDLNGQETYFLVYPSLVLEIFTMQMYHLKTSGLSLSAILGPTEVW